MLPKSYGNRENEKEAYRAVLWWLTDVNENISDNMDMMAFPEKDIL